MVHRSLQHYLDGARPSTRRAGRPLRPRRAGEARGRAERASIKYKQVEFLGSQLGAEFDGVVNGISSKAVYVELNENKCRGTSTSATSPRTASRSIRSGNVVGLHRPVHMGAPVRVRVVQADVQRRELEFEWLG